MGWALGALGGYGAINYPSTHLGIETYTVYEWGDEGRDTMTGWWFGTCFIFPYIGNSHPS